MPISAALTPAAFDAVIAKLDSLKSDLPFLVDLDNEDLASLPKLGDRSLAFVKRTLELARQDDSFLPRNIDLDELARDLALFETLEPVIQRLTALLDLARDTRTLAGSDAYATALDIYHAAKRAGKGGGLESLLSTVAKRFAQRPSAAAPIQP
jgi:hypothetical protein